MGSDPLLSPRLDRSQGPSRWARFPMTRGNSSGLDSVEGNRAGTMARARASSLFTSIDRGGWCGIADRLWREQEEGVDERVSFGRGVWGRAREKGLVEEHPRTLCNFVSFNRTIGSIHRSRRLYSSAMSTVFAVVYDTNDSCTLFIKMCNLTEFYDARNSFFSFQTFAIEKRLSVNIKF